MFKINVPILENARMNENINSDDYRYSHQSEDYGKNYDKMYAQDYYSAQWNYIEAPILLAELRALQVQGKRTYLDFACGTGRILKETEDIFESTTGIDISEQMAMEAERLCKKSHIIYPRDITASPLDQNFDVITSFRFFLNAQPDLRASVLDALAKMQVSGGNLIINVHVNPTSILGIAYRIRNKMGIGKKANTLAFDVIKDELRAAGYEIEKKISYSYWPRVGPYAGHLQGIVLRGVERLQCTVGILPESLAQSYMLVCSKS